MTADMQTAVGGMARDARSDVDHLRGESVEGLADIAAGRVVDPDQNISLPPSIVALATGTTVEEVVAQRARPSAPMQPAATANPEAAALARDLSTRGARRYAEIREQTDAHAREVLADSQTRSANTVAQVRRRLGLGETTG